MTFFFSVLDIVLTGILIYDTLSIVYLFRKERPCQQNDYIRICFSWILFLTIINFFTCNREGFFRTLIRSLLFLAKAYVTLPILGGTMKINKYLFDDGNAQKFYENIKKIIESKLFNKGKPHSS